MNRKNIKTHLISFIFGVFVTYIYFDVSSPRDLRPRAIERSDDIANSVQKSDMFLNSIQNIMQNQMMDMADTSDLLNVKIEENDDFYFVKIQAEHINRDSLDIKIGSQGVAISGRIEIKSQDSYVTSSFERSFSLPSEFDTSKPIVENTVEEIIIKFKRK